MAEQTTLANSSTKRQQHKQHVAEQESQTEAEIAARLEYYAPVIGAFKDDPMLDAMMANIRERRREMNADDNTR